MIQAPVGSRPDGRMDRRGLTIRRREGRIVSRAGVIIKACLNGGRPPSDHPALPVRPDEFAREARAAVDAGAQLVHVHPRRADGSESIDADAVAAIVTAIREGCPGLPVGVTTGAWVAPDQAWRLDLVRSWTVLPDFASVNFSEDGAIELAQLLLVRGVGVEAGLGSVEDAVLLTTSGLAPRVVRVLVETDGPDDAEQVRLAAGIDKVLDDGGVSAPRFEHGWGRSTWAVLVRALEIGYHVRIGLEDTLELPDGSTARDNADLVSAAVRLALEHGREVAGRT